MKKLGILASGTKQGGGSGFENLVNVWRAGGMPNTEIVAVATNIYGGGVEERAKRLGIHCWHFNHEPITAAGYQQFVRACHVDCVALSGYLKHVEGLDPRTTFNIHPAKLPSPFGGDGMHGHHVHEAVMSSYHRGEVQVSGVSMHFVTEVYDEGPVFFTIPVPIYPNDTAETLGARVNRVEHIWQPWVTQLVVTDEIGWDGRDPTTLKVPEWYRHLRRAR